MARPKTTAPRLYLHRHSGRWCVNLSGRRVYLSRDRAEAERLHRRAVGEWLLEGGRPPPPDAGPPPNVAEALLAYWRHAQPLYSPKQTWRIQAALEAAGSLYGGMLAKDFDQLSLQAVRASLLGRRSRRGKDARRQAPLSRGYVNALVGCLQTAWRWLGDQKLVPAAQAAAVRAVARLGRGRGGRETPRVVAVDPAAVAATLPHCGPTLRAMITVQQLTGMRPGEVCDLRPADVSRRPGDRLEVPDTRPPQRVGAVAAGGVLVWVYVPRRHKTMHRGKRRIVAVGPRAQAALLPFLGGDPDAPAFSPRRARAERFAAMRAARQTPVQPSQADRAKRRPERAPPEAFTASSYGKMVALAVRRANRTRLAAGPCRPEDLVPAWRPNMLRKLTATASDDAADRQTTSAILGHATPDMASVYAEASLMRVAAYMAKVG